MKDPPPASTSRCSSSAARPSAPASRRTEPQRPRRASFPPLALALAPANPSPPLDAQVCLGPLRLGSTDLRAPSKQAPVIRADCSLQDQGVLGLQVRQQGSAAEVRLQLRQGDGVVEASLRETGRGVEIQLVAGPEQQALLNRVAETLTVARGDQEFDLDGVTVNTQGDPKHRQQQRRARATDPNAPPHRRHQRSENPSDPPHPSPRLVGTSYLC